MTRQEDASANVDCKHVSRMSWPSMLIFELRPEALATEGIIAALTKQVTVLRTHYKLAVDAQLGEEPTL